MSMPKIFDLYYDVTRLQWDIIQDKLDYKLKLNYYPKMNALLVPNAEVSLGYFILD
jgi:hypothetical protein